MNFKILTPLALAAGLAASSAAAQTVANTSLQDLDGATYTTTTTANGTTTASTGPRITGATTPGQWYQSDVGGGGSVGITKTFTNDGDGAVYFSTDGTPAAKADLAYNFGAPVLLSDLNSVSFDFYHAPGTIDLAPVLRFNIYEDATYAGSLVLEYVYQHQTAVPDGWTTLSASLDSGIFWATKDVLGPTFAAADGGQKTLQSWINANAGTLRVTGVSIGIGSGWTGAYQGAVDHVAFDFEGGPSNDFNFAVANVPEPGAWALMILGFGATGAMLRRRRTVAA